MHFSFLLRLLIVLHPLPPSSFPTASLLFSYPPLPGVSHPHLLYHPPKNPSPKHTRPLTLTPPHRSRIIYFLYIYFLHSLACIAYNILVKGPTTEEVWKVSSDDPRLVALPRRLFERQHFRTNHTLISESTSTKLTNPILSLPRCPSLRSQSRGGSLGLLQSLSVIARPREHRISLQGQNSSCVYNSLKARYFWT